MGRLGIMHIASAPVPVRIVSSPTDWPGWLSFIAALIALVIAVYAIWQAYQQANDSRREIAAERRKVFELEILRDLLGLEHTDQVWSGRSVALVEALPHDDLSLWRAVIPLGGPDQFVDSESRLDTEAQDRWEAKITEILDKRGVPSGRDRSERLWQALVDDVRKSIKIRVEGDYEDPERKRGRRVSTAQQRSAVNARG